MLPTPLFPQGDFLFWVRLWVKPHIGDSKTASLYSKKKRQSNNELTPWHKGHQGSEQYIFSLCCYLNSNEPDCQEILKYAAAHFCESRCAILTTGARKKLQGEVEAPLRRPCESDFDWGCGAVCPPSGGASIADGYTPSALAGARPLHPLPPKGEESNEMQKRENQRRRRSACVSACEPPCEADKPGGVRVPC